MPDPIAERIDAEVESERATRKTRRTLADRIREQSATLAQYLKNFDDDDAERAWREEELIQEVETLVSELDALELEIDAPPYLTPLEALRMLKAEAGR